MPKLGRLGDLAGAPIECFRAGTIASGPVDVREIAAVDCQFHALATARAGLVFFGQWLPCRRIWVRLNCPPQRPQPTICGAGPLRCSGVRDRETSARAR